MYETIFLTTKIFTVMELDILKDIVIIFALSTIVNFLFNKIKVPTVVGYLLTGIVAGPHLLKLISSVHDIELMAEIGVVLLMFTIGMEFSLKHLFKIRYVVFLGGMLQVLVTAAIFFGISHLYHLDWKSAIFISFLGALSSSALVLKILQDRSELSSNYGRTVLGILIFQDILFVPLILFTNILGDSSVELSDQMWQLLIKTVGIILFVYVGNKWLFPKLLHMIALAKNQELFMMCIFLICLSIALLTSALGMSLAFGAFLAGLMISESEYTHNTFGQISLFKDLFTSFFFVSIGMLLDLSFVQDNYLLVIATVLMVVTVKTIVAGGASFVLGHTFRGTIMVGLALSQVGEFSFLLAKIGSGYNLISNYYYQLFLAVAIITISLSPFLMQLAQPLANLIMKLPLPGFWVNGLFPLKEIEVPEMRKHLVIIGKDVRAEKLAVMAKYVELPYVSIVFDPVIVGELQKRGDIAIYGDAVNEPILRKAHVDTADIIVLSVGDVIAAMAIVDAVRKLNKHAYLLVRAKVMSDSEQLYKLGADQVVPEKLETAIDLFERILANRLLPKRKITSIISTIRDDYYGIFRARDDRQTNNFLDELPNLDIMALKVDDNSAIVGQTLAQIHLRNKIGVTLLAIKRDKKIIEHPDVKVVFQGGDILYILGRSENLEGASDLIVSSI